MCIYFAKYFVFYNIIILCTFITAPSVSQVMNNCNQKYVNVMDSPIGKILFEETSPSIFYMLVISIHSIT